MNIDEELNLENIKEYYNLKIVQILKESSSLKLFLKNIKKLSDKTIENLIIIFNYNYYHDNEFLIPDQYFDALYEYAKKKNIKIKEICYQENNLEEIDLPEEMNSIKKFYPDDKEKLESFLKKNFSEELLISSKLDGVSCLLIKNKKKLFLYTKGNTEKGRDISHILKTINFDISKLEKIDKCVLRGELIIKKENKKFLNTKKNLRNQVIGLINLKNDTKNLQKYIDIVFYQIYTPVLEHSKHFTFFKNNNLLYPKYEIVKIESIENITEFLSDTYGEFMEKEIYEIDGLVISNPNIKFDFKDKISLNYCFAFKKNIFFKDVEIKDIQWNISNNFKCTPILIIEPVKLNESVIEKISAFNAKKLITNKIGIGSIIRIKLSGNIIPNIDFVITTSTNIPFPENFYWDENKVNIYIQNTNDNIDVISKKILKYYYNFKIKKFASTTISSVIKFFSDKKKIINIFEYIDCVSEFFENEKNKNRKILGIKKDELLYESVKKFKTQHISIINILIATNKFKLFEETKFLNIFKNYPEILDILKKPDPSIKDIDLEKLYKIEGINTKVVKSFENGMTYFLKRKNKFNSYFNIDYEVVKKQTSVNVVFTGVKDKDKQCLLYLKNFYTEFISVSNNNNITYVVTVDENYDITEKIKKAKKYNIPIITIKELYDILKKNKS